MLGKEKLKAIADRVLALSSADQTEVLVLGDDEHLTRFAANVIHQNVSETDVTVRVRSVIGKKIGVASGNDLSDAALKQVVESAETVARFQQDNPDFQSLPEPQPVQEMRCLRRSDGGMLAGDARQRASARSARSRARTA